MFRLRHDIALLPLCLGALMFGCAENEAVAPKPRSETSAISASADALSQARSDSLAQGLAIALGDSAVRIRLRDDLRDSPFPLHAIQLGSYLRGEDGMPLAGKAASGLGIGRDAFVSLAESGRELELVMPRILDRVSWDGGEDLEVTATQSTFGERIAARHVSETGFAIKGRPTEVKTIAYSPQPYVIARPAEQKFPAGAERLRAQSPKHAWNTVSTPSEERALMRERGRQAVAAGASLSNSALLVHSAPTMIIQCGDPGAPPDCDSPPPPPPSPPGVGGGGSTLPSAMTKTYCYTVTATSDRDNDRIRDDCEAELASRLAPLLNIGNDDWVPGRQPYWAASRSPDRPDNVQIIYALSYLRDGGFALFGYTDSHEGDSEFIILEVINSTGSTWGIIQATLSAHFNAEMPPYPACYGNLAHYCGTDSYYWDDLDYPQGPYPRIWSSLGKHANYRNRAACESGADLQDSCGGDYIGVQIPAPATRNLGNFYNVPATSRSAATWLANCTRWAGATYLYGYFRTGQECFWQDDRFSGWDPLRQDAVTPYKRLFEIFGF
jgi:hypothetical protein